MSLEKVVKRKSKIKIHKLKWAKSWDMPKQKCEYLDDKDLPVLFLGLKENYRLKSVERDWIYVAHQTAGICCHQKYLRGTILTPKIETEIGMNEISNYWHDTSSGILDDIVDVNKYRSQLRKYLAVDCRHSYNDFEEGIYPIDCNQENIKKLCKDKLPKKLDNFLCEEGSFRMWNRWHLYILGPNCD